MTEKDYNNICAAAATATQLEVQVGTLLRADDPLLAEIAMDIMSILRPEISDRLARLERSLKPLVGR
jgi:hypothetical protein